MSKRLFGLVCAVFLLSTVCGVSFAQSGVQTPVKPVTPAAKTPLAALAPTDTVYVLNNGTEYHRKGCRRLLGQQGAPMTHVDAVAAGHMPCNVCKPAGDRATGTLPGETKPGLAPPAPAAAVAPVAEQPVAQPTAKTAPASQRPADALMHTNVQEAPDAPSVAKPDPAARYGPPATSQPPAAGAQGTVFITKTGKMYHRAACRTLRDSKIPISLEDAKARGYTPCTVCKP